MGLLYQFPVNEDPLDDRINLHERTLSIKNYGLPMIFWGYLSAIIVVIFFMFIAIKNPSLKMIQSQDPINRVLAYAVLLLIGFLPVSLLGFFFYEKEIIKKEKTLTIIHRLFWLPISSSTYELKKNDSLLIESMQGSDNIAKQRQEPSLKGFENRGYTQLFGLLQNDKKVFIDRNSRQGEMSKLKKLLEQY